MATLGEVLTQLDGGINLERLMAQIESPILAEKLEARAVSTGCRPAEFADEAVKAFCSSADDDAWLKLLGRLQDAPSPAAACLKEMLSWALKD